jgi:hypothetical protein
VTQAARDDLASILEYVNASVHLPSVACERRQRDVLFGKVHPDAFTKYQHDIRAKPLD